MIWLTMVGKIQAVGNRNDFSVHDIEKNIFSCPESELVLKVEDTIAFCVPEDKKNHRITKTEIVRAAKRTEDFNIHSVPVINVLGSRGYDDRIINVLAYRGGEITLKMQKLDFRVVRKVLTAKDSTFFSIFEVIK